MNYDDLHFHSLHLDAPGGGGFIKDSLHGTGNALSVTQDLMEALGTEDVSQRGLSQKSRGVMRVFHVGHGDGGVGHAVVDDGVHGDRHRVSG